MATLPPPTPGPTPNALNMLPRLVIGMILAFVVVLVFSALRDDVATAPLPRLHLQAVAKALTVAKAADAKGGGTATEYNVSSAATKAGRVGVVKNLGAISGNPRAVEYNIYSSGAWVEVCVVLPVGGYPVYPVTCPGV
jgi:hypothetical protein